MSKDVVVVWFDIKDADKILHMHDFVPCMNYGSLEGVHPYEYGRVEYEGLIIVYRCCSIMRVLSELFSNG